MITDIHTLTTHETYILYVHAIIHGNEYENVKHKHTHKVKHAVCEGSASTKQGSVFTFTVYFLSTKRFGDFRSR